MSLSSKKCCVPGCVNSEGSKQTLHSFPKPAKENERFNTWVLSIGGDIIGMHEEDIYKHRRVCHLHFEEKYCCRYNRISNIAVPTLNLPGPLSLPKFTFLERRPMRTKNASNVIMSPSNTEETASEYLLYSVPSTSKGALPLDMEVDVLNKENTDPMLPVQPNEPNTELLHPVTGSFEACSSLNTNVQSKSDKIVKASSFSVHTDPVLPVQPNASVTELLSPITGSMSRPKLNTKVRSMSNKIYEPSCSTVLTDLVPSVQPNESNSGLLHPMTESLTSCPILNTNIQSKSGKIYKESCSFVLTDCHKTKLNVTVPIKTKKVTTTAAETRLYKKLIKVSNKLSKCRSVIKKQRISLKAAKKIITNPDFIKAMDNFSSTAKMLTLMQFRECKKKEKGRRFKLEEKIMALSILKQSPKGYKFLRKYYILPAPQTLHKLLNKANISAGINAKMFAQLKNAAEKMKTEERLCILLFDEISLKPSVAYNERKDIVVGFVNNGFETKLEFADHAQVFMVRGLVKNYKQPVAYSFAASATKGYELAKQLKEVIKNLQKAGLIVVATVCDQGSNNRTAINHLIQETRGDIIRAGKEPKENVFIINDQEIVPLYDPPHLLKCIRNNLMTKNLKYDNNRIAKWEHIELLHKENPGYKGIRLIPKLTDNHVVPAKIAKMKVKYASQVFSQTVATNMGYLSDKKILPVEAKDTADILLFFDRLFDSLNGSYAKKSKYGKPLLGAVSSNSLHHAVWKEAKIKLKNMSFINILTGKVESVPTINNWVWTLDNIEVLLQNIEIKYGCKSVWMRHLNQDPIENFFGAIRSHGCRNTNPTPDRFESAFTTLLVNNLSSVHAAGANCEVDNCQALHALIVTDDCEANPALEIENIPDIIITPLEDKRDPRQIGALQYVSGYFVKKAQKNIFKACIECKKNFMSESEPEYLKYREFVKQRWLCSPSESLLQCVSDLQDINYNIIKNNLQKQYIKELIKTIIFMHVDFNFIKCNEHKQKIIDYLINLSCRFFIYNYCKEINRILTGKRDNDDEDDNLKCKAKKYFKKCYKRRLK